MKALPMWQPWASLVAMGAKRIETRSWPAPRTLLGQTIAIHATKGGLSKFEERTLLAQPVFEGAFVDDGFELGVVEPDALPRGALVATVTLARCKEITPERARRLAHSAPAEYAFGDYRPGRFAWVLEDLVRLHAPIPAKGHQGVFPLDDDIARQLGEAAHGQEALPV